MVLLSLCDFFKYFMCQGLFALATRWLLRPEGKNAFRVFISKTRPLDLCYPLILLSTYLTFQYILIFINAIHNCLYCCCCDATGKVRTHFAFSFLKLGLQIFAKDFAIQLFCHQHIQKLIFFSLMLFIISFLGWVQIKKKNYRLAISKVVFKLNETVKFKQ